MKFKLKDGIILKATLTRQLFKFPPIGLFQDSARIMYKGDEYVCYPKFENGRIKINHIHKEMPGTRTSRMTDIIDDFGFDHPISNFKKNLILIFLNRHKLNYKIFKFKDTIYKRRKTILSFAIPIVGGITYYLVNHYTNDSLMNLITSNVVSQSFIFAMTIIGIMKLWRPFAVKQGFTEKDAEELFKRMRQREADDRKAEEKASF